MSANGMSSREVQEWLCLHGYGVEIDGVIGPATRAALARFKRDTASSMCTEPEESDASESYELDDITAALLRGPILRAVQVCEEADPESATRLGESVVAYAEHHLTQSPREIGGPNMGPWVRLYMDGHEGDIWAWCMGFATYVLRQACLHRKIEMPLLRSFSCDAVALDAEQKGMLRRWASGAGNVYRGFAVASEPLDMPRPGDLFLVHRNGDDWTHTGIVMDVQAEGADPRGWTVATVEGNTNDDGHREGYEVCARVRSFKRLDFIRV